MYYANAEQFSEEIREVTKTGPPDVNWLCIHSPAIGDIDFSAGATLQQVYNELKSRNIRVVFAELSDNVRAQLDRYQIADQIGKNAFYYSLGDVIEAYRRMTEAAPG